VSRIDFPKDNPHGSCRVKLQAEDDIKEVIQAINGTPYQGRRIKAKPGKREDEPDFKRAPMLFENPDVPTPVHPSEFRHSHKHGMTGQTLPRKTK
jgi:RNA recognition motif-containing protein